MSQEISNSAAFTNDCATMPVSTLGSVKPVRSREPHAAPIATSDRKKQPDNLSERPLAVRSSVAEDTSTSPHVCACHASSTTVSCKCLNNTLETPHVVLTIPLNAQKTSSVFLKSQRYRLPLRVCDDEHSTGYERCHTTTNACHHRTCQNQSDETLLSCSSYGCLALITCIVLLAVFMLVVLGGVVTPKGLRETGSALLGATITAWMWGLYQPGSLRHVGPHSYPTLQHRSTRGWFGFG